MKIIVQLLVFGFSSCTSVVCSSAEIAAAESKEFIVEITSFAFVPQNVQAQAGDKITWINRDIVPHTATGKNDTWDTGTLLQNESHTLTVSESMEPDYLCRFHLSMTATISMGESDSALNSINKTNELPKISSVKDE